MLGRGYLSHYSEYALSSTLSVYITLNAIVSREYNSASLCHLSFMFVSYSISTPDMHVCLFLQHVVFYFVHTHVLFVLYIFRENVCSRRKDGR